MAASLTAQFEKAVEASKALKERPDNDTLLKMYALYKQGTEGDNAGKRPGMTDPIGRRKFDAWLAEKGKSKDDGMKEYVALVNSLK
jgi:diazepam-binding inhibitor (GABA receptor modulator, acyl-CoA-binding protein)